MSAEQPPSDVRARLQNISERLRKANHLDPEAQQELAGLVEELGKAIDFAPVPSGELAHLTDSATHLLQALEQRRDKGVLTAARDRLEQAIVSAESRAPFVAGIAQRLLATLASLGI
jgi:hypothetical protein